MEAMVSEIGGQGGAGLAGFGVELFARGVRRQQERRCPHCGSIVYSRRHAVCGVCCEPLPAGCTFSSGEAAGVEDLLRAERARHRRWMLRSRVLG